MSKNWIDFTGITVDPGICMGLAIWKKGKLIANTVVRCSNKKGIMNFEQRAAVVVSQAVSWCVYRLWEPKYSYTIFCEQPTFFESHKGMTAARDSGLTKLCHIAGMLHGATYNRYNWKFVPVSWKGQLPKDVMIERINKCLKQRGYSSVKSHAADAVGIGCFLQGWIT